MLNIRPDQQEALEQTSEERFRAERRAHAARFWPDECAALGAEGVEARIQRALDDCAEHGITIERDVARYVDLLFVWGDDFAISRKTPWARGILEDSTLDGPLKVHQLSFRTKKELERDPA